MLTWDKPAKTMTKAQWSSISADGAPPGTYTPNMSEQDKLKWKAKLVGAKSGPKQVEIRKTTRNGTQLLLIVSLNGFRSKPGSLVPNRSDGYNVHISCNGPAWFNFEEMSELEKAVQEAKSVLEK